MSKYNLLDLEAKECHESDSESDPCEHGSAEILQNNVEESSLTHYSIKLRNGQKIRVPRNARLAKDAESSSVSTRRIVPGIRKQPRPMSTDRNNHLPRSFGHTETSKQQDGASNSGHNINRPVGGATTVPGTQTSVQNAMDEATRMHTTQTTPNQNDLVDFVATTTPAPSIRKPSLPNDGPRRNTEQPHDNRRLDINHVDSESGKVYRRGFACRCCGFYSEIAGIFNQHLASELHKTRVLRNAVVAKPFWCTFCKLSIDTGLNFTTHLNSKRHKAKIRSHE